ncbi:MAG: ROK family protein [Christensenellales bacterium]|jgi:predicted NBD/HSP70 family sugar kinase
MHGLIRPALDPNFQPMAVVYREYLKDVEKSGQAARLVVAIERSAGQISVWETKVFKDGHEDKRTIAVMDRVVKTLLWARGGFRIKISGHKGLYQHLKAAYAPDGARAFDEDFMANVYEKPFEVLYAENPDDIATAVEKSASVGRHLDGCRIGFDAGGSDRKVSAVIDGEAVYSEEVVWHPKITADPKYHYEGILSAMKTAASHMPRVDAIGVSSAGVYIDNRIMVASLFLSVNKEDFAKHVKTMYIDIAKEIGNVPLEVANDGDVTALAGAMSLEEGNLLGIAMGTSEAGGYVDEHMNITGWLNELAFAPVDFNTEAMVDEWSGDYGCGVKYFSQDGVIKLAPAAGIELDEKASPAEKLKVVQGELEKGNRNAEKIFESIGTYFGYGVAYYSLFYDINHVLVMGRVTSGKGGSLLIKCAQEVLDKDFPELAKKITLHLPDEKSRRVGQSIAAASLPEIPKK